MKLATRRPRIPRQRSADIMVQRITEMVLERRRGSIERIGSELDLIKHFGVSRAVVREALRILERDGVITVKPGPAGGIFCANPTSLSLSRSIDLYGAFHDITPDDLVEARMELEVLTARLAAARATQEDLENLSRLNEEWKRLIGAEQTEAAARTNVAFHVALGTAAHNPVFVAFMDALEELIYESALEPKYPDRRLDYVVYSHEVILAAVREGDADEAGARMRTHLQTFRPNAWRRPSGRPRADRASTGPAAREGFAGRTARPSAVDQGGGS